MGLRESAASAPQGEPAAKTSKLLAFHHEGSTDDDPNCFASAHRLTAELLREARRLLIDDLDQIPRNADLEDHGLLSDAAALAYRRAGSLGFACGHGARR